MMQSRPSGLFGAGGRNPLGLRLGETVAGLPGLPGPISGYGGGTWNVDGSVATMPAASPTGDAATAIGWGGPTDDATDAMRQASVSAPPQLPAKPRGIFGSKLRAAVDASADQPVGATAMGVLPDTAGLPRRNGQPFDYGAALAAMLPQEKKHSTLQKIASFAAPVLMGLAGNQAGANAFIQNQAALRQARERQKLSALSMIERWKHDDFARQQGADLRNSAPHVIGRSMVQYNPDSGSVDELYDGPEDFETYADKLGLAPGSPEYFNAVEDYVLRGNGPTAFKYDRDLETVRHANRVGLEGVRQGNRTALEGIRQGNRITTRQTPTYSDLHPRSARGGAARPTATGPGGKKMEYDGTKWVPVN